MIAKLGALVLAVALLAGACATDELTVETGTAPENGATPATEPASQTAGSTPAELSGREAAISVLLGRESIDGRFVNVDRLLEGNAAQRIRLAEARYLARESAIAACMVSLGQQYEVGAVDPFVYVDIMSDGLLPWDQPYPAVGGIVAASDTSLFLRDWVNPNTAIRLALAEDEQLAYDSALFGGVAQGDDAPADSAAGSSCRAAGQGAANEVGRARDEIESSLFDPLNGLYSRLASDEDLAAGFGEYVLCMNEAGVELSARRGELIDLVRSAIAVGDKASAETVEAAIAEADGKCWAALSDSQGATISGYHQDFIDENAKAFDELASFWASL